MATIIWTKTTCDMLKIFTSDCGVYEVRENYPESEFKYQLIKNGYYNCSGNTIGELKADAEWEKRHC